MTTTTSAPATTAPAATKVAPAKKTAPAKAAPKKAPAKTAEKQAATGTSSKIKWTLDAERDEKGRLPQHGIGAGGVEYAITGSGSEWTATATVDGKTEVLAENVGHTKAYTVCVKANAEALAA
jgi:hypothetical protein